MGGCLLKRLELRPKGAVQFVLISNTICLSCYALLFFLGCDNIQMAGTTIPYTNNSNMEPLKVNLTAACNFNCLCTETDMEPVCGNNGLTYFSPCHAGCAESFSSRSNFANCACGKGYGHIKRAPAYTFGQIPASLVKPVASPNAKAFNIRGITQKGVTKIPGGVVGTQLEPLSDRTRKPGPAAYTPLSELRYKRPPAYTCQPPARPPYQAWDMWTCPPNMYWPYVPSKKASAYSIGQSVKSRTVSSIPGPGAYDPNFQYQQKTPPAFSFSHPFPPVVPPDYPPPNRYCEKKLLVEKKLAPAPSFGIRHTPYLGEFPAQPKSSKLDLVINAEM